MSGPRSSRPSSRRSISDKETKYQIRVYAEGEKTEEGYLTHLWRENRAHVAVNIARHVGSTPLKLVSTAVAERRNDLRTARRVGPAYNEYWCVFDVDEHPGLIEALQMAAANEIKVALSSPCLELWFLIHFDKQWADIDRHEAQRRAESHLALGGKGKVLTRKALQLLDEHYKHAHSHALLLDEKHTGDGASHPWNPSSNMWELTETIADQSHKARAGVPFSPR